MIDTHSHIYDEAYTEDFDEVVARAKTSGVQHLVMPGIDSSCHQAMIDCAERLAGYATPAIGLHPTSVAENWKDELQFVFDHADNSFCAIGEIGLDEHWSKDFLKEQMEVFEAQLNLSADLGLPVIIHSREATEDIFSVLDAAKKPLYGVFHAFSGSYETYCRIKKYGDFKIGIGGVITYKNSHTADFLHKIPMTDILLETDAPWLTPVPFRGKRNESSYIKYVAEKVAALMNLTFEEIDRITTENAIKMFRL